jgi:hypothetical protein
MIFVRNTPSLLAVGTFIISSPCHFSINVNTAGIKALGRVLGLADVRSWPQHPKEIVSAIGFHLNDAHVQQVHQSPVDAAPEHTHAP